MHAVAHDADAIRQLFDLLDLMADIDAGDAVIPKTVENFEQILHLPVGQWGCRLVQHKNLRIAGSNARAIETIWYRDALRSRKRVVTGTFRPTISAYTLRLFVHVLPLHQPGSKRDVPERYSPPQTGRDVR